MQRGTRNLGYDGVWTKLCQEKRTTASEMKQKKKTTTTTTIIDVFSALNVKVFFFI